MSKIYGVQYIYVDGTSKSSNWSQIITQPANENIPPNDTYCTHCESIGTLEIIPATN